MYLLAGLALVFVAVAGVGFYFYRIWDSCTWRKDQAAAITRIDRLIKRLEAITTTPGSGLTIDDIGDVAADWVPLRAELVSRHSFRSWLKQGRMRHTLDDRFAHALWTLAHKRIKPLNRRLDSLQGEPLPATAINEIIDVLSTDLDREASNVVSLVARSPRSSDTSRLKLSS